MVCFNGIALNDLYIHKKRKVGSIKYHQTCRLPNILHFLLKLVFLQNPCSGKGICICFVIRPVHALYNSSLLPFMALFKCCYILIESMMGLRPRQGNLRLVFRLFSLIPIIFKLLFIVLTCVDFTLCMHFT